MKLVEGKRKLPDGWQWVKLGEICKGKGQYGTSEKASDNPNGIPVLRMGNISNSRINWSHLKYIFLPKAEEVKYRLTKGDILFNRTNSAELVGKTAVFDGLHEAVFASYLIRFRVAEDRADPFYLSAYINSAFGRSFIEANMTRAIGQVNINASTMEAMPIPLPPLDEQKRIAAILNEKMEAVERSRQAGLAQLETAKVLSSAYLRAVFNSPEAQKWQKKKLGEVGKIVSGITLGRKINNPNTRPVPYLRVANVKDSYLDLSSVYEIEATESEIERWRLKFGDILLTEGGDPDKLGRGTYWKEQISECIHQNHIFRVRFDFNEFCPEFISAQLCSLYGKAYFLAHAKQTTGIATINQQVISNFPLMIPPLSEQKQIAATFSEQMAEVEKLRKSLEEQLDAINKLPAAFLRQAFNGEL